MADEPRETRVEFLQLPDMRIRLAHLEPWGVSVLVDPKAQMPKHLPWDLVRASIAIPTPGRIVMDGNPMGFGVLASVFERCGDPEYAPWVTICRSIPAAFLRPEDVL